MPAAAGFPVAQGWKQPECPWMDEWINKTWYIPTTKYYSALNRKGILTHATVMDEPGEYCAK